MVKLRVTAFFCMIFVTAACSAPMDSRFSTPKNTIETLFSTYGVEKMSEEEVRRRLEARQRFTMLDSALHRACFADWQSESDQGLAGFVFGRLVAAKDHLTTKIEGQKALVGTTLKSAAEHPVVLKRTKNGWRIVLQQSVPEAIKRQLYEVYRRSKRIETRSQPAPANLGGKVP